MTSDGNNILVITITIFIITVIWFLWF